MNSEPNKRWMGRKIAAKCGTTTENTKHGQLLSGKDVTTERSGGRY